MISPRLALVACLVTVGVAVPSVVVAESASASPKVVAYKNCAEIHKHYSGGIAKAGVKSNTTHSKGKTYHRALKGKIAFSTALYNANKKSDADKDGIACEIN